MSAVTLLAQAMFLFELVVIIHAHAMPIAVAVKPGVERTEKTERITFVGLVGEIIEDDPALFEQERPARAKLGGAGHQFAVALLHGVRGVSPLHVTQ